MDFGKRAGLSYVDRGDPSDWEWKTAVLTIDGNWYELDVSSVVPVGTALVHFNVAIQSPTVNASFQFRENGNTYAVNTLTVRTFVADVYADRSGFILVDSDRKVEYKAKNVTFTNILIACRGWFI